MENLPFTSTEPGLHPAHRKDSCYHQRLLQQNTTDSFNLLQQGEFKLKYRNTEHPPNFSFLKIRQICYLTGNTSGAASDGSLRYSAS